MVRKVYALKNSSISDSASGGAFPTIIQAINELEIGGGTLVVYGAVFSEELHVRHERADTPEEYRRFRGSKYVQSNLGTVFSEIIGDLKQGKRVLFSGTPCQVNAVNHYVMNVRGTLDGLYTVDIICHGTPSERIWLDFLVWLEKKRSADVIGFSFRYQKARWKSYPVMAEFSDGHREVNTFTVRAYTRLYLTQLIMRECCYRCKFANQDRPSDLTIGDFWGIEKVLPDFPFRHSVSQILVNSERGERVMEIVETLSGRNPEIAVLQCQNKDYLLYQHNLTNPTECPKDKEAFWRDYENYGIDFVLKRYAECHWRGRIKHCISRALAETGVRDWIREYIGR